MISLEDEHGMSILTGDALQLSGEKGPSIYLLGGGGEVSIVGGSEPWIEIIDDEGFQAVLGSTGTVETRTGRTNQTSAATLTLFDKAGTVIWSAP